MLLVISIDEFEKWDEIVKGFNNYDIYYLSGYTKAFQMHNDGDPYLIYYENTDFKAINVIMKRDISKDVNFRDVFPENTYFDLSTPYGYGGFLLEGNITEENLRSLNREYSEMCLNNKIVSEFVRFHPELHNSVNMNNIYQISSLSKTISLDLSSRKIIWDNFSSKNRNMVRKAQKTDIKVYWGRNEELLKEFIVMYNNTMTKDNAKEYYFFNDDFYNSILYDLKNNHLIFYSQYQNKKIAMSIILFTNNRMHYHLSAIDTEFQNLAPNNLLLYEAACWGCDNGYKSFHLGGGVGSNEDGLYKFKCSFNRNSYNIFEIGKKIFDDEKYEELVKLRSEKGTINTASRYFPLYRA